MKPPRSQATAFGVGNERAGFGRIALIVAVIFVMTEVVCCLKAKERDGGQEIAETLKTRK